MIIVLNANIAIVERAQRELKAGTRIRVSWATLTKALEKANVTIDGVEKINEFEVTEHGLVLALGNASG